MLANVGKCQIFSFFVFLAENEKAFSFWFLACKNEKTVFRIVGRPHAEQNKTKNGRFSFFVRPMPNGLKVDVRREQVFVR